MDYILLEYLTNNMKEHLSKLGSRVDETIATLKYGMTKDEYAIQVMLGQVLMHRRAAEKLVNKSVVNVVDTYPNYEIKVLELMFEFERSYPHLKALTKITSPAFNAQPNLPLRCEGVPIKEVVKTVSPLFTPGVQRIYSTSQYQVSTQLLVARRGKTEQEYVRVFSDPVNFSHKEAYGNVNPALRSLYLQALKLHSDGFVIHGWVEGDYGWDKKRIEKSRDTVIRLGTDRTVKNLLILEAENITEDGIVRSLFPYVGDVEDMDRYKIVGNRFFENGYVPPTTEIDGTMLYIFGGQAQACKCLVTNDGNVSGIHIIYSDRIPAPSKPSHVDMDNRMHLLDQLTLQIHKEVGSLVNQGYSIQGWIN